MADVAGAAQVAAGRRAVRSSVAARMLSDLMAAPVPARRRVLGALDRDDLVALLAASTAELGTPYAVWQGDPVGFAVQVLGEALWSGQRKILRSMVKNQVTAVPSCFGSGKTRSMALAATYFGAVYPPGTAVVVTIAPRWRQVARQIWPEIRGVVTRADLFGTVDKTQWKIPTLAGIDYAAAYGIAAAPTAEDAVQGIHAPNLLLVVDEAGGISQTIGQNMRGLLTGSNAAMVAIGNPPTDDEGSWFERLCAADDRTNVIPLDAYGTPNFTGEVTAQCRSCPPAVPPHKLAKHLVDEQWVANAIADHGDDSRFVIAKVRAQFPRGGPNTLIPWSWVDAAVRADEPEGSEYVRLCDLGLPAEAAQHRVQRGAWVRLGVDVAADGGDELAITRCVGDLITIEKTSAGQANTDSVAVAGMVLEEIRRAEQLARALGTTARVRVKVDIIGVGWGVYGLLDAWGREGRHQAEIVAVDVRESPNRDADTATLRPARKRDEMWLAMRGLLASSAGDGEPVLRLRVDDRTVSQLSAPRYATDSQGMTVVESKDKMRGRGVRSPDRAEACCLAVYEPLVHRARVIA
ncbi:hypothetical protein ABZ671_18645 [Micromonospora sp. NPDC006766]|uniref:hypothetical protein n=1 Tax=Micromonospora sp. NPDC006766 TaxID=3154778 RepID=UPI00340F4B5B